MSNQKKDNPEKLATWGTKDEENKTRPQHKKLKT